MEQTILTESQRQVIKYISEDKTLSDQFYLAGGTALAAYYLNHRYSDDLDFFTNNKDFPQLTIEAAAGKIQKLLKAKTCVN